MKTIALTKGMVALVDDADFEFISQWNWYACCCNGRFYAKRDVRINGKKRRVYMHRVISGAVPGQYSDHKDGVTLNNQRGNLRVGTQSQNMGNCSMQSHNTSGFKGVCWSKEKELWVVHIKSDGRSKFIGYFSDPLIAASAYDEAAVKQFGEFARTNAMMGLV